MAVMFGLFGSNSPHFAHAFAASPQAWCCVLINFAFAEDEW
jgi:hypothetical protein